MERYSRRSDLVVKDWYSTFQGVSLWDSISVESVHRDETNTPFCHSPNIGRSVSINCFSWTFASASSSFDIFASSANSSCISSMLSGAVSARVNLVNLTFEAFSWY